jgi:MerR family transcriptional regulator, light-induced transcriptional regulator
MRSLAHYSPKQAAQQLGVSESSVKRWLDQGIVPVLRTAGGHRRISQESFDRLLQRLRAPRGFPAQEGWEIATAEATTTDAAADVSDEHEGQSTDQLVAGFCAALSQGGRESCRRLLYEVIRREHSPSTTADMLITPAMHGFGHQWEQGDLAIYQERRACGIALDLIHELKRQLPVAKNGPVAIGGTPEGDEYQLPTALIELALIEHGWRATSLGCNLPMSEFRSAVLEYQPKVVWVSLSYLADEETFVREFNATASALPEQTALLIGGRAATDGLRPRLRYTGHCDTLGHLIELAASLAGKR